MNSVRKTLSEQFLDSTSAQQDSEQWETLIARLLQRLELPCEAREEAERMYHKLGTQIADNLGAAYEDILIYPQGSMRTQTTVNPRHPQNFDIDIIVELSSSVLQNATPEEMFTQFGDALKGNEEITDTPVPKSRCWRLQYPNKPFYFDVTPALPDPSGRSTGASLKVRDPETGWSPSNPKDFAQWFCEKASLRFPFHPSFYAEDSIALNKAEVIPLPNNPVPLDDILRRAIQLVKVHRDNYYWYETPERKATQPISVILVTLATTVYEHLYNTKRHYFKSPIQLVLAIVDEMPSFIERKNDEYLINNPKLPSENFADKWNRDHGLRKSEFDRWHNALKIDLGALLFQSEKHVTQDQIRRVFGEAGVDAWKASRPTEPVHSGLLAGLLLGGVHEPAAPVHIGSEDTVG